jgi:tRNA U34 5-methylaminomethyl-2-thiouridine-forming methyltransferase MnmC
MDFLDLIKTEDGSHTLFNARLNEHYHSTHGAIQESRHVFIEAGLKPLSLLKKEVRILEIGFGTGLNALLTWIEAEKEGLLIQYTAIEPFPLKGDLVTALNYAGELGGKKEADLFIHMHSLESGTLSLGDNFTLHRDTSTLSDFEPTESFDLIYFDAFAPDVQPELWTETVFEKMARLLVPGGVLVTYCAKGEVKRNMKKAGFSIERLPGPPGKREMTRAWLNPNNEILNPK